jgi:predicted permease
VTEVTGADATMFSVVSHKDVILALLPTCAVLLGFLLVFIGFMASTMTVETVDAKTFFFIVNFGLVMLLVFLVGIVCITSSFIWLLYPDSVAYFAAIATFAGLLVGLAVSSAIAVFLHFFAGG